MTKGEIVSFIAIAALTYAGAAISASKIGENTVVKNFASAKHILKQKVHFEERDRVTLYCGVTFNENHTTNLPAGFMTDVFLKRSKHIEWEHVVPAENFGRNFTAWNTGDPACSRKGRMCAEKVDQTFRYIESDLYNLWPAIGAVNALRSNYDYTELPGIQNRFGCCEFKIMGKTVEPPDRAKGAIARTWFYMAAAYPKYVPMSRGYKMLMNRWNERFPVTAFECRRSYRIEKLQQNANPFVKEPCMKAGLYHE